MNKGWLLTSGLTSPKRSVSHQTLTIIIMNTEELYIWRYGIDKLPKGLLEYGKSDVCDIYDESKRQKFQNLGQWMWQNNDGWRENLPPVLYLVCNKKPGILKFDFLDKSSIELKIVSEEFWRSLKLPWNPSPSQR